MNFANQSLRTAFNTKISERIFERFEVTFGISVHLCIASIWGKNNVWWWLGVSKEFVLSDTFFGGWLCPGQNTAVGNS